MELGVEGWFAAMAAFLVTAARTISGKIPGILFPIVAFVAIVLQHSPANMGYSSIALIHGDVGVDWGEVLWWNLVPAAIGNLIGGAALVALLFWYALGQNPERRLALRRADDPVRTSFEAARGGGGLTDEQE